MKVGITKTELFAMPNIVWSKFFEFMMDRYVEYTPIQKTTALCFRYFYAMDCVGHAGFFANYEESEQDEIELALTEIGLLSFAEKLRELARNQVQENLEMADEWFLENAYAFQEIFNEYYESNFDEYFEIVDENYTMRPPRGFAWLGVIEAGLMLALMIIFSITTPQDRLLICISFFVIAFPGLFLIAFSLFWKATVVKDTLTIRWLFRKRSIQIDEISAVKPKNDSIVIYKNGKRFASMEKRVSKYNMFIAQLWVADKLEELKVSGYTIRQSKTNMITGIIGPIGSLSILITVLQRQMNPAGMFEKALFLALMLGSLYLPIHYFRWRVMVLEDGLSVRKGLRKEKKYLFSDITKIGIDDKNMVLFSGEEKAVKIPHNAKGCTDLSKRLQELDIPFYRDGKA